MYISIISDNENTLNKIAQHISGVLYEEWPELVFHIQKDDEPERREAVAVDTEIKPANFNIGEKGKVRLTIDPCGRFECYIDGIPVRFKRSKTRLLLRYLTINRNHLIENEELLETIWGKSDSSSKSVLRTCKAELTQMFEDAGCDRSIVKQRGMIGLLLEANE